MGFGESCGGRSVAGPRAVSWSVGFAFKEGIHHTEAMCKVYRE